MEGVRFCLCLSLMYQKVLWIRKHSLLVFHLFLMNVAGLSLDENDCEFGKPSDR